MCELITIAAALAFTAAYFVLKQAGRARPPVLTAALMFWGAALMWSVDCVHSAMAGEGFFDLSASDALLGAIILAAGLLVFGILLLLDRRRLAAR